MNGNLPFFRKKLGKILDKLYKIHKIKGVSDKNIGNLTKCESGTK